MGYNSVVFVLNDRIHDINDEPEAWWKRVWTSLVSLSWCETARVHPGTEAVWSQHADVVGLIMVGGNHATVLGGTSMTGGAHYKEEDQDKILKEILRERGYVVYKKKASCPPTS